MPADRGEPWPGAIYNGFSGGAAPPEPATAAGRRLSRGAVVGGIAATAVGLGLAAGLLLRPDHRTLSSDDPEAHVTRHMPIEVSQPPPPLPLPRPAGKLEVLDPTAAAQAAAAAPMAASRPAAAAPVQTPAPAPEPTPPAPRFGQAAPPLMVVPAQPAYAPPPAAARDPCAAARSRAEAIACADPEIAGYDRELNRAYRRAMRSGAVAPGDLRADQRDWLSDRETAARRSPQALAELYQDRIDELNRIADAGGRNDDPGDDGL